MGAHQSDVLGKSASDGAWDLQIDAEMAMAAGEYMCAAFVDCAKAYERVPHAQLRRDILETGFPRRLANMAMAMYSGNRFVKVGEAVAKPVVGNSGLMPGCGLAVALLKAHLKSVVMEAQDGIELSFTKYVDDMILCGKMPLEVVRPWKKKERR